jgi:hypothetical protein
MTAEASVATLELQLAEARSCSEVNAQSQAVWAARSDRLEEELQAARRQLAEALAEIERLQKLEAAFMRGDLKHV